MTLESSIENALLHVLVIVIAALNTCDQLDEAIRLLTCGTRTQQVIWKYGGDRKPAPEALSKTQSFHQVILGSSKNTTIGIFLFVRRTSTCMICLGV